MFEGAISLIRGKPDDAIKRYERSSSKLTEWPEWQNTCQWLITWCYCVQGDWVNALDVTKTLIDRCNWSKCVFTYQYAALLKMIEEESTDWDEKLKLREEIDQHLRLAPTYKRSFVGKTVYVEKFVTKRCQIYWQEKENEKKMGHDNNNSIADNDAFMLPILDLFLFWNIFYTFKQAPIFGSTFLKKVDIKLKSYPEDGYDREKHYYLILMKGIILKNMGQNDWAIKCLTKVLDNEDRLRLYSHLAPLASLELGILFQQTNELQLAQQYLNKAITDYTHYLNETLVHIRAHYALGTMKKQYATGRKISMMSLNSLDFNHVQS